MSRSPLNRLNVAFVVSSLRAGGAERVISILANALAEASHHVVVVTESRAEADHYRLAANVKRIAIDTEWSTAGVRQKLVANAVRIRRLRACLLSGRFDLVISFGDTTNIRVLIATLFCELRIVASERTDPREYRIPAAWSVLRRLSYRRATAIVVQTRSVARWAATLTASSKVVVIPNPVPAPENHPKRPAAMPSPRTVLGVGRLVREKGFDLLIEAFFQCGLGSRGWSLVILGEGPTRPELESLARKHGQATCVHLPGLVSDPQVWMQHADLFVLSSRFEGFPNALLEAMACEMPCIAFDCPSGPSEIIRDRDTGVLVKAQDVNALARALAEMASDEQLRMSIARKGKVDVLSRFGVEKVAAQWVALAKPRD